MDPTWRSCDAVRRRASSDSRCSSTSGRPGAHGRRRAWVTCRVIPPMSDDPDPLGKPAKSPAASMFSAKEDTGIPHGVALTAGIDGVALPAGWPTLCRRCTLIRRTRFRLRLSWCREERDTNGEWAKNKQSNTKKYDAVEIPIGCNDSGSDCTRDPPRGKRNEQEGFHNVDHPNPTPPCNSGPLARRLSDAVFDSFLRR